MVKDTLHDNAPSRDDSFVNIIGLCNAAEAGDAGRGRPMIFTYVETRNYLVLTELLKPSKSWYHPTMLEPGVQENMDQILHNALYFGDKALVKLCLEQKPEYDDAEWFRRLFGLTRGEAGEAEDRAEILSMMMDYGVSPTVCNADDVTLLHLTQGCNNTRCNPPEIQIALSRVLIDHGADIDAIDRNLQSTPLGWRCRYGDRATAAYLLERGADPNGAGAPGAKPLAWAERRGYGDIAEMLKRHGATL
jgi:ankyrin repeat protein